jgi:hypothetical protein
MLSHHVMSLVTQPLKIKVLCSFETPGNSAATHCRIPEYPDQEPRFLGHPPYSLVPVQTELTNKRQTGRVVTENGKTAMRDDGGVQICYATQLTV